MHADGLYRLWCLSVATSALFRLAIGCNPASLLPAYLAMTAECCDHRISSYCTNETGCFKTPWSLGFMDAGTTNPWDR